MTDDDRQEMEQKRAAARRVLSLAAREMSAPGGHGTATLFDLYQEFADALVLRPTSLPPGNYTVTPGNYIVTPDPYGEVDLGYGLRGRVIGPQETPSQETRPRKTRDRKVLSAVQCRALRKLLPSKYEKFPPTIDDMRAHHYITWATIRSLVTRGLVKFVDSGTPPPVLMFTCIALTEAGRAEAQALQERK